MISIFSRVSARDPGAVAGVCAGSPDVKSMRDGGIAVQDHEMFRPCSRISHLASRVPDSFRNKICRSCLAEGEGLNDVSAVIMLWAARPANIACEDSAPSTIHDDQNVVDPHSVTSQCHPRNLPMHPRSSGCLTEITKPPTPFPPWQSQNPTKASVTAIRAA